MSAKNKRTPIQSAALTILSLPRLRVYTVQTGRLREIQPEPLLQAQKVPAEPSRELLTEKMLADRWVCSVARLQRWRTVGEGPPYLKIVGKVLYRLKDIEAYEEASLVRKTF